MHRNARTIWLTSFITSPGEFKPGGTGLVTTGRVATRVTKSGYDRMGRWCYQLLGGKGKRDVLLICVYNCCEDTTQRDGTNTAFYQQKVMLLEERRDPAPRKQFEKDLLAFVRKMKRANGNIPPIIMGDWNAEAHEETARELFLEFELVDVF